MLVFDLLPFAQHAELDRAADPLGDEAVLEGLRVLHRLVVDADHDVAGFQAGLGRGALGVNLGDQRA